jgi:hypothetical protein
MLFSPLTLNWDCCSSTPKGRTLLGNRGQGCLYTKFHTPQPNKAPFPKEKTVGLTQGPKRTIPQKHSDVDFGTHYKMEKY